MVKISKFDQALERAKNVTKRESHIFVYYLLKTRFKTHWNNY